MNPLNVLDLEACKGGALLTNLEVAGRASIFATLAVLEPFVRFTLTTLATLGTLVAIIFGFLIVPKGFPTWFMLGMSVGCFLLLAAYYAVMRSFRPVSDKPALR